MRLLFSLWMPLDRSRRFEGFPFQVAPKGALRRNRASARITKLLLRISFWTRKTLLARAGSLDFRELSRHYYRYRLRLIFFLRLNRPLNRFCQVRLDGLHMLADNSCGYDAQVSGSLLPETGRAALAGAQSKTLALSVFPT
jgi:hypothetical protein